MSTRSRAWCFTLNNYTDVDEKTIDEIECQYFIYGKEIAPTTKTPHLQGYIYFTNAITFNSIKKKLPNKCHIEKSKGSPQDNVKYCSKEGNTVVKGKQPIQGERKDLNEIRDEIINGKTVDEIALEDPMIYHQYGRTLEKLEDITQRSKFRTEMTTCEWITGPTGCGKSHKAFTNFNPDTHYVLNTDDKGWWEGYKGQDTVIINDFKGEIRYGQLLQLIDKWPYSVPRRGRQPVPFVSKHIIITSIMQPEHIYHKLNDKDGIDQLLRRITCTQVARGNTVPWPKKIYEDEVEFIDEEKIEEDDKPSAICVRGAGVAPLRQHL